MTSDNDDVITVDKSATIKNRIEDFKNAINYTRWFLTLLGIWPYVTTEPSKTDKCVSIIALTFGSITIFLLVVPIWAHVALREMETLQLLMLLGPMSFEATNIVKHLFLVMRSESIKCCIRHMETDWRRIDNDNDREIMMKNLRFGHGLTVVCMGFMYSGAIFYQALMPLLRGKIVNEFNETVRPLIFPGADIFIDVRAGYNYEIVFFTNCVAGFFLYTIVISICDLAAVMVSHVCGQIQIVVARLENLVSDDVGNNDDRGIEERIAFIVRCHVRILRFTTRMDEILREVCLIEVVASTLIICLLEYYCMTEWENSSTVSILTYVMLLISLCFNIFIFCHIGEVLTGQCQEIGKASYMIDWYKLPSKASLSLIMVIAMSNYPRKLTAGRMMELSIYTFGSIMKTSVAYLNMLRAVAE